MSAHSTNYRNTFITIAEDSSAEAGVTPPEKVTPTVVWRTHAMISAAPYRHTSDDVIFTVWADRNEVAEADREGAREQFFAKGQPCLRASDLGKKYGWGVHSDGEGRVALYAVESPEYRSLAAGTAPDGTQVTVKAAMRSRR